jgi:hypothetical protein
VSEYAKHIFFGFVLAIVTALPAAAQTHQHDMSSMTGSSGWHVMQDAAVWGLFNHQGGPRGGNELRVPNWWMGMFTRKVRSSDFTINTMFSLDPLTVGEKGYRELFQVGETFDGKPLIDYQHPHDLFMQLAASWRFASGRGTAVTIAGGPSGEPALGPVAFMHRASAMEIPLSPLSHHTLDSTHIAFGVVTAAVDRGPWMLEASVFNGREPDENRWDFDFGRLDSVSGRLWFRPNEEWELQFSSGRLTEPEALAHGNVVRTTASASWLKPSGENFSAATVAYGINDSDDASRAALLLEGTLRRGRYSAYGRFEFAEVESAVLSGDSDSVHGLSETVAAITLGTVRELPRWRGLEAGIGAAATFYGVPERLRATHGERPVSFQVFLRLRPAPGSMGRMWNMYMTRPMLPAAANPHAGHQMP